MCIGFLFSLSACSDKSNSDKILLVEKEKIDSDGYFNMAKGCFDMSPDVDDGDVERGSVFCEKSNYLNFSYGLTKGSKNLSWSSSPDEYRLTENEEQSLEFSGVISSEYSLRRETIRDHFFSMKVSSFKGNDNIVGYEFAISLTNEGAYDVSHDKLLSLFSSRTVEVGVFRTYGSSSLRGEPKVFDYFEARDKKSNHILLAFYSLNVSQEIKPDIVRDRVFSSLGVSLNGSESQLICENNNAKSFELKINGDTRRIRFDEPVDFKHENMDFRAFLVEDSRYDEDYDCCNVSLLVISI